ncbi:MAG: hypothetical protein H6718_21235 [Polyangiaceae bacterium]|nr:hypothetical protein [Myxococcales bacterium]MCB9587943.1 hypothetical protein [Polyangiaceae bacterium]
MRRLLDNEWFAGAVGVVIGGLIVAGLVAPVPIWVRRVAQGVGLLAMAAPVLPFIALIPWHFIAVRRGLIARSRRPFSIAVADGTLTVEHGASRTHCDLSEVTVARRAFNDNFSESRMLEDAIGLFSANRRELVRVPVASTGIDELIRALRQRNIPIDDVPVSAPTFLD